MARLIHQPNCELCSAIGGELIWQNADLRVIMINEPHFVGFVRVIWQEHISEMTDLQPEQRSRLMKTVFLVEDIMRQVLKPTKVNLASLGNMTPHLHWHIIPRFTDDINFPNPVWAITPEQTQTAPNPRVNERQYKALIKALKIALWD